MQEDATQSKEEDQYETAPLEGEQDGRISPSQMTDTSSRDTTPRTGGGLNYDSGDKGQANYHKKEVAFASDHISAEWPLSTIPSVSDVEDDTTAQTVGLDVPSLCVDNIRTVYNEQTAENKYHVSRVAYLFCVIFYHHLCNHGVFVIVIINHM